MTPENDPEPAPNPLESKCRACSEPVKPWFAWADYPIFNGCTDAPREEDELFDFHVGQCTVCGFVQQTSSPPLEVLYREPRAFGYGRTWEGHYDAFATFIGPTEGLDVLEVGGGNGTLLKRTGARFDVEPNPQYTALDLPNVSTTRTYFENFETVHSFDLIYASHLIEHVKDPVAFFKKAASLLKPKGAIITACPDVSQSLAASHLNAFTPDHFNYFTPETLTQIAARVGLVAVRYQSYRDHGMYLRFERWTDGVVPCAIPRPDAAAGYRQWTRSITALSDLIDGSDVHYLYGAHTFTLTLLRFLSETQKYKTVLDNEPTKHGRRLTGTRLVCEPPEVLALLKSPLVVVALGAYTTEIIARLKEINPTVRAISWRG